MHIVLYEPQIPPNTGNIGRLCLATKSTLHLIEPLAFDISEKSVRRAGLDYWKHVDLKMYKNYDCFVAEQPSSARFWYFTKFAQKSLYEVEFSQDDYLIFGRETSGLPENIQNTVSDSQKIRIPMPGSEHVRSLNLAGAAHIALYEALRQTNQLH
ncbi:MAG: tRNA (cytidine(34)-2'-O)-methyltransferase [Oligoflexia bacterium]|nr:tRNA (cytidine(34)-2'-O)-methyltransferase [Oligoflexia bacterium]